jgi:hypothetical protein
MISENLTTWLGLPVTDFKPGQPMKPGFHYRLRAEYDSKIPFNELFAQFMADPLSVEARAIIIGVWGGDDPAADSNEVVKLLTDAAPLLPKLEGIYFGDIISEECEMSWINQSDVSPVLKAYPALQHFAVRGGNDLSLGGNFRHEALRSLVIETGGMPRSVVQEVLSLDLPNLEHLELWLGTDDYGWNGSIEDLRPLLSGQGFPNLKHLGIRNALIADDVAAALPKSAILDRVMSLDLSLGCLTDKGGIYLLNAPEYRRLKNLDLHHHYFSDGMMASLQNAFPGANLNEQEKLDSDYGPYVSVGE